MRACAYGRSLQEASMAHVRSLFFDGPLSEVENKALKAYRLGRPSDIIWNITNRCNLLCDHCYMSADGHALPDQLSDEETIALIDQMGELGVPLVFISGGEPMMRSNFWDIIERAHSYGMHIVVSTNATFITRENAKRLKANGVDWIATSLYGPPQFHDQMVGVPGTHDRVINAIKVLREEGVGVALKSAVSKDTLPFIPHIIAKAKELDARLVYLCDLITSGRSEGEADARISAPQWKELADWILGDLLDPESDTEYDIGAIPSVIPYLAEKLKAEGVDVTNGLKRLELVSACPVGKGHMNINSEGGIMPCQFAQDWTVGNVREMTLTEATKELYKLDQQEAKGICAPENCEYSRICRGCRTKAWQATGDAMFEDDTCLIKRLAEGGDADSEDADYRRTPLSAAAPCVAPPACG
jgi:radical SAM protein with 4Fe4S-binding SPASM domain